MTRKHHMQCTWFSTLAFAAIVACLGCVSMAQPHDGDELPPPEGDRPRVEGERADKPRPRPDHFEGERPFGPGGFDRPFREGGRPGRPPAELTAEQIEQAIAILKLTHPVVGNRLAEKLEKDPQRVKDWLAQAWPRIEWWVRLKADDPETFQLFADNARLMAETHELAAQLRDEVVKKDPQRVAELQEQLRQCVTEHFDVRQKMQENEIKKLEERLEVLRRRLEDRGTRRDELIEERLAELAGGDDDRGRW